MKKPTRGWMLVGGLLALLLVATPIGAQEALDGTWTMTLTVPEGAHSFTITLETDGETVKGTRGENTYEGTFTDGKLELTGDHYIDEASTVAALWLSGTVDGDTISGEALLEDFGLELTGKKEP